MNNLQHIADSYGPWIALCAVLLWYIYWLGKHTATRDRLRKQVLSSRLDALEAEHRRDLRDALTQAVRALDINSRAFDQATAALTRISDTLEHCPCANRSAPTRHPTFAMAANHE